MIKDWYEHSHELRAGDVFTTREGYTVKLDRRVAGDATKWFVADSYGVSWSYEDSTVEESDLIERLDELKL